MNRRLFVVLTLVALAAIGGYVAALGPNEFIGGFWGGPSGFRSVDLGLQTGLDGDQHVLSGHHGGSSHAVQDMKFLTWNRNDRAARFAGGYLFEEWVEAALGDTFPFDVRTRVTHAFGTAPVGWGPTPDCPPFTLCADRAIQQMPRASEPHVCEAISVGSMWLDTTPTPDQFKVCLQTGASTFAWTAL